jgi:hypothetical protein
MRASSDDTFYEGRAGGGARRSAPSIPTPLASWVFLCLHTMQQPNTFSICGFFFFSRFSEIIQRAEFVLISKTNSNPNPNYPAATKRTRTRIQKNTTPHKSETESESEPRRFFCWWRGGSAK